MMMVGHVKEIIGNEREEEEVSQLGISSNGRGG
jgi:hypothetical protein